MALPYPLLRIDPLIQGIEICFWSQFRCAKSGPANANAGSMEKNVEAGRGAISDSERLPRGISNGNSGREHPRAARSADRGYGRPEGAGERNTAELANPLSGFCPPGRQFDGITKSVRMKSESLETWDPALEFGRRGLSPLRRRVPHPRTPIWNLLVGRGWSGRTSASDCRIRQSPCDCTSIRSGTLTHHDAKIKWTRSALLDQKLIIS
jgi:hypothetical protein